MKKIIITSATVLVLGLGATAYHYYSEYSALQEKVNKAQYKPVETAADHMKTKETNKEDESKKEEDKLDSEEPRKASEGSNVKAKEAKEENIAKAQQAQSQQVNDNKEKTSTVAPDSPKYSYRVDNIEGDTFYAYSFLYGNTSFKRSNLVDPSMQLRLGDNVSVQISTEGEFIVDQIGLDEFRELETAEGSIPYPNVWEEADAKKAMEDGTATVDYETTEDGEVIGDGETIEDENVVGDGETIEDVNKYEEDENLNVP
ncbi:hypothetical protein M3690_04370 [Priestia megaterium]|uniref:hypothetical protein n=1 Tax=Priestia megaterium TaxID=1404 RepID=UPI00203B9DC1|nr:hypothetical protein [Priestia megaterium]MCM3792527.1 hypothetical protein [Priestia megaterium]